MMRLRKNSFDPVTLEDAIEMVAAIACMFVFAVLVPNFIIYVLPLLGVAL